HRPDRSAAPGQLRQDADVHAVDDNSLSTRLNLAGPGCSRYCGSTPGPQEAEPRPCRAKSALTQIQSGSGSRSVGCLAAASCSLVQERTVSAKCGRPSM